jgi:hypothetical protein
VVVSRRYSRKLGISSPGSIEAPGANDRRPARQVDPRERIRIELAPLEKADAPPVTSAMSVTPGRQHAAVKYIQGSFEVVYDPGCFGHDQPELMPVAASIIRTP